jgi:hypothetical protein
MADPGTLTLTQVLHGWPTYIKEGPTVVWLTKIFETDPSTVYLADPLSLRLTQVFHGWPKYIEADPIVLMLTQEPLGWPKYFNADQSI